MYHPFENIPAGQLESLNRLQAQFVTDTSPVKADLLCGVYQTEEGLPLVLQSVISAKRKIYEDPSWNHEYPSSHLGEKPFLERSTALLFGGVAAIVHEKRIAGMQTLGGSGACHMGATFLKHHYWPSEKRQARTVYIPAETWVNHANVFQYEDFDTATLPYYDNSTHSINATTLNAAIDALPSRSIVVLQVCGNNPTGCDPSPSEWDTIVKTFTARNHFAFLDVSYMGFVSGDAEEDCEPIRKFVEAGIPLLVAATYGKAFGVYGERVGHLCVTAPNSEVASRIEKQMKLMARAETGAMPRFGALIVSTILGDAELKRVWEADLREVARQLRDRRAMLKQALEKLGASGDWNYIIEQKGMFLYTGFDSDQVSYLRDEHHVYLQENGRLSIAGLNPTNIAHVALGINALVCQKTTNDDNDLHRPIPLRTTMDTQQEITVN